MLDRTQTRIRGLSLDLTQTQMRAFSPPGRPLEAGWLQEFMLWLWHRMVLTPQEALPWPRWVQRTVLPVWHRASALVGIGGAETVREWVLRLLLTETPSPDLTQIRHRRRLRLRGPLALSDLLRHAIRPYSLPIVKAAGERIEAAAGALVRVSALLPAAARVAAVCGGILVLLLAASTPLGVPQQALLLGVMWVLALLVREVPGYGAGLVLMALSIIASSRYVWWRLTQTLQGTAGIEWLMSLGLLAAECYTWLILVLGFIQNARPLGRRPVSLPSDRASWPSVDVFIPTYNEPLSVVKPTVLAASSLDWPADKLNVYLLDDGRREEFRAFAAAAGVRYLTRRDNAHAKAGNLNHALQVTHAEFVAIFDCDHIPVRSFLTTTMGWFDKDPGCAMLQTPHHFYSPDPFERNLGTFREVPNEGGLFYGLIQEGNDLWNASFFCGSCAVLRRRPLLEVGGIAVETVTEDAHTALKLHRRGYNTAYLRKVLAGGLATESLAGHIGQRVRWARGMAQIFRIDNPFTGRGLNFFQRLCYANGMLHFFSGLPRLVFLTAPLAYLYFQFHIINAAAATLAVYAVPHLVQSALANSHIQGRFRHSIWNEAYEAVLSWYIALPTALALINPKLGKFNVTAKGGLIEQDYFAWRISAPYLVLVLLNIGGALLAIPRMLYWNSFEADTVTVNLIWTLFNLTLLGAVLGVAAETRQVRGAHRAPKVLPAQLRLPDGRAIDCRTEDFSMSGLRLSMPAGHAVPPDELLQVVLWRDGAAESFPARSMVVGECSVGLKLEGFTLADERRYVQCTFGRPDAWRDWNAVTRPDRPLASFVEVFSFGATGYVRLFQAMVADLREIAARLLARARGLTAD